MKNILLFVCVIVLTNNCKKEENNKQEEVSKNCICYCNNPTNDLAQAKQFIIGSWLWKCTEYQFRGAGKYTENEANLNKSVRYQFTKDSLYIYENNILTTTKKYMVEELSTYSNILSDSGLVLYYYNDSIKSRYSILNIEANCLGLINGYDDAGGNSKFVKN